MGKCVSPEIMSAMSPSKTNLDTGLQRASLCHPRRTPGLRRDELAQRAGISVEWYVKLEQNRAVAPSREVLIALSGALCLNDAEERRLLTLGSGQPSARFAPEAVPPVLEGFVSSLSAPAWGVGERWDLLTWNAAAADLLGGLLDLPEAADRSPGGDADKFHRGDAEPAVAHDAGPACQGAFRAGLAGRGPTDAEPVSRRIRSPRG